MSKLEAAEWAAGLSQAGGTPALPFAESEGKVKDSGAGCAEKSVAEAGGRSASSAELTPALLCVLTRIAAALEGIEREMKKEPLKCVDKSEQS